MESFPVGGGWGGGVVEGKFPFPLPISPAHSTPSPPENPSSALESRDVCNPDSRVSAVREWIFFEVEDIVFEE